MPSISPIAHIHTGFKDKFGIPRQSGRVQSLMGRIIFLPEYRNPDALRGIEAFSHLWLIFDFSKSHRDEWSATVRPPRLGGNTRVGVFASRSPFRPNPIGLSAVKLLAVEQTESEGLTLLVSGVDLLDGTPILDIKPYLPFADCIPDAVGGYADSKKEHRLKVVISPELTDIMPDNILKTVADCIADDPRPSYQDNPQRVYSMRFDRFDIHFTVCGSTASVIKIDEII